MSINDVFSTALSGMNAADAVVNNAANNLANLNSQNYQATQVNLFNSPAGGARVDSYTANTQPGDIDANGQELSNVDPAREMVHLMLGKTFYNANAIVIRTADSMLGTLLDVVSAPDAA